MRELTNKVYKTYFIEATQATDLYRELAQFSDDNPGALIESLTPGMYDDEDGLVYTLMVTVAQ